MKIKSEQKLSARLDRLVQKAVDKMIENHRQKGELIGYVLHKEKLRLFLLVKYPNFRKEQIIIWEQTEL